MGTDTTSDRPTLVILVRHGVTPTTGQVLPGRAPGLHLSDAGQEQAREVAQRLQGLPLTALYTSPMERAQETAVPTVELFGLAPQLTDGLVECDFGEWTGGKLAELAKLPEWQTVQKAPSEFRFPGGESFVEMQERMVTVLGEIASRHRGGMVVCFSHADPIKAAVTHLAGRPLDDFQRVAIDPASVSVVSYNADGTTTMLETNSRSGPLLHLLEHLGEAGQP